MVALARSALVDLLGSSNLTGSGVLVGVVDNGVDEGHPAIADSVVAGWDQLRSGTGLRNTTDAWVGERGATPLMEDHSGHGTHVAAIATGRAPLGIAPGAGLATVRIDATDGGLLDGVDWIFDLADQLDRPAVVNISQGLTHVDGHDGSDPLSVGLDEMCGAGRLVCVAAGNEGEAPLHVTRSVAPGGSWDVRFVVYHRDEWPDDADWRFGASIVGYPTNGAALGVEVTCEAGSLRAEPGESTHADIGDVRVHIDCSGDPMHPSLAFRVNLKPYGTEGSLWNLRFTNHSSYRTRLDAWSREESGTFRAVPSPTPSGGFTLVDPVELNHRNMLASPACAHDVVCVGAIQDRRADQPDLALSDPQDCSFSSCGPTRDGRRKPEAWAPGVEIVSARSRQVGFASRPTGRMTGTSFATPVATGLLALALEVDRSLTPLLAQELFRSLTVQSESVSASDAWPWRTPSRCSLADLVKDLMT